MKNLFIFRIFSVVALFLCLFMILAIGGCSDGEHYDLGLELVTPLNQDPFQGLAKLSFTIVNYNDPESIKTLEYNPAQGFSDLAVSIDDLDYFAEFVITIKGLDPEGKLVSFGRSGRIESSLYNGGQFAVYFARVNEFSQPPAQLLRARDGLRLCMPNEADLLVIGGTGQSAEDETGDSVGEIEYFSPAAYSLDFLKRGDDVVYLQNGIIGHAVAALDGNSTLVIGGYSKQGDIIEFLAVPRIISSLDSEIVTAITMNDVFEARYKAEAASLVDRSVVIVCGGMDENDLALSDCAAIDAESRELRHAFDMKTARRGHSLTAVYDDEAALQGLLVYGGSEDAEIPAEWWVADASSTDTLDIPSDLRRDHAAILMDSQRILIIGGSIDGETTASAVVVSANCIDGDCPVASHFPDLLSKARMKFTLTALSPTMAMACGGLDLEGNPIADCERIVIDENGEPSSVSMIDMSLARTAHDAQRLSDGTLLVAGGSDERGPLTSVEVFMPHPDW